MKYLLLLIMIVCTSFFEAKQRLWIGLIQVTKGNDTFTGVLPIGAKTESEAKHLFNTVNKNYKSYKGGVITKYLVWEITDEVLLTSESIKKILNEGGYNTSK